MKELLKECQGHCPLCNSDDLTYFGNEIEDDWLKYPYECENCGNTGNEWYKVSYDTTITEITEREIIETNEKLSSI